MIKQSAKTAMDRTNGSRKVRGQKRHNEQKRLDGSSGYGSAVGWKNKTAKQTKTGGKKRKKIRREKDGSTSNKRQK